MPQAHLQVEIEQLRKLDDERSVYGFKLSWGRQHPFDVVVHDEQPRAGCTQPSEPDVAREIIRLVVVLNERLEIDPGCERVRDSNTRQRRLKAPLRQIDVIKTHTECCDESVTGSPGQRR